MMEEVQNQLQRHGGNFSAYMQELIVRDLDRTANIPEPSDQQALIRLVENFHPTATEEIQQWIDRIEEFQQPFFIYRILCALHDAITNNRPILSLNLSGK